MKELTRTMLGALLLAGSSTAVLAAAATQPGTAQNQPAQNQPAQNQPAQNQPAQNQPAQKSAQSQPSQGQPTTTNDTWSQDMAARNPSHNPNPQTASTGTQSSSTQASERQSGYEHGSRTARRSASIDPTGDRMTEALNLLGSDGYTNIGTLTPQGQQFLATAKMNGRDVSVLVDPQTHQATNRG
jgi:hypothetical protein